MLWKDRVQIWDCKEIKNGNDSIEKKIGRFKNIYKTGKIGLIKSMEIFNYLY